MNKTMQVVLHVGLLFAVVASALLPARHAVAQEGPPLPAPTMVQVVANGGLGEALVVAWEPPDVADVAGYRILRREKADGPSELVGETTQAVYIDLLLSAGTSYTYTVQSFDADGLASKMSAEATAVAPDVPEQPEILLFLPTVRQEEE